MNLEKSPQLALFSQLIQKESSLLLEGLWDAPKAALLSLTLRATGKNILVVTGERRENRIIDDLDYFGLKFLEFPSWETLPGEEIPPSPDIVGKRFLILSQLLGEHKPQLIFCPLQSLLQKIVSPKTLKPLYKTWKIGDEIGFEAAIRHLTFLGYRREKVASDKGEFAKRQGIIDLFPLSSFDPVRIEFFGDTIDSIRTYDPASQKSITKVSEVFIVPASEANLLKTEEHLSTLLDYLGKNTLIVFDDLLSLEDRYVAFKGMPGAKSRLFGTMQQLLEQMKGLHCMLWSYERAEELSETHLPKKIGRDFYSGKTPLQPLEFQIFDTKIQCKRCAHPFRDISDYFSPSDDIAATSPHEILQGIHRLSKTDLELHLLCSTESEENALKTRLQEERISLPKNTIFERAYLSSGFALTDSPLALLPMTEFTRRFRIRRQKWRSNYHSPLAEFHDLSPGDLVVHFHNGIGKYLGIEKKPNHLGQESEFMVIEYAEESKLYVPIASSYLVSRYIGAKEEMPTLTQLGTKRWQRARFDTQKAIIGYARDLLHMSAAREIQGGFQFQSDSELLLSFESEFPFVETEDQLAAIAAIKQDMLSGKAMDRLICGDVGYGKTEVAMRAAFKAVVDGKKQVAVLVPTTVLAMQHFETFSERMANFPIRIGIVSRFISPKEVKETVEKVKKGEIDILIGTHRLIGKDVLFKDLGLIIIDEEQRFGVRAKEHLKKLKTGVDCITLSATPIPRTLYMSLVGIKDVSLINTPPQDRLPIKTHVCERDPSIIQNALLRELSRDGQAFFIHNRVETIHKIQEEVQKLLPEARVAVSHGQMDSDEIDEIFHAFKSGAVDILIATTIVENGIDIPNANTILIDQAQHFGLADLYQMRGRVGRWNRPAYAYLLVPKGRRLPELAQKRVSALVEASSFGGGMKVAMRDLEIRGAGDILGTEQSGQISAIGFHLYCKLLKRAIEAMKKKTMPNFIETKMEFPFDAKLPEDYINEPSLRMEIYHRLGEATSFEETAALLEEMKDRFGPPPPPVLWLYHLTRIRIAASQKGYTLLKFNTHLHVEKQRGKMVEQKDIPLPRFKSPQELERIVLQCLDLGS